MPDEAIDFNELKKWFDGYVRIVNHAKDIKKDELDKIGERVYKDYDLDKESRADWEKKNKVILELAKQMGKKLQWAGEKVANVKYPILSVAALQFSARAYPNLVKGKEVVKCQVIGKDQTGEKAARADRVRQYMGYQIIDEMEKWEEDMDQLLICLPLIGCYFKKTYPVDENKVAESSIVSPENLVVNYYAKSLEPRATEIIELYPHEIEERIRKEQFLEFDYTKRPQPDENDEINDDDNRVEDESAPHIFLEQHRRWDLDDDGYDEPYIITIHRETQKVVRITARFNSSGVTWNQRGEIVEIKPIQYYTKYKFFPAFDGSFYEMGFGSLLSPINETINTTINQLLDAGTIANRQGGFLGRGIRLTKGGATSTLKFKQGEWKQVENTGDDLRKGIVPLPTKPPSPILFKLLGLMLEGAKELASQADVLSGEQPKANVPATTTLALIEQGLKVFSGVYKRIYRSLKEEFEKIRQLNILYLNDEKYRRILDDPKADVKDFEDWDMDIVPIADSAEIADVQRLVKAEALWNLRGQGFNDEKIKQRYLEALQIPDYQEIMPDPDTPPPKDPALLIEEAKLKQKDAEIAIEDRRLFKEEVETRAKVIKLVAEAARALADAEAKEEGIQIDQYMAQINGLAQILNTQNQALQQKGVTGYGANKGTI